MYDALIQTIGKHHEMQTCHVRREVAEFAIEMESVLQKNDHKSGWDKMVIPDLYDRIEDEYEELTRAYDRYDDPHEYTPEAVQDMRKECIDLANFCMFFCHNNPKKEVQ